MASRKKGSKKSSKKEPLSGGSGLKLIQHKHCQICGKAQLLESGDVCSDDCQKIMDENIKKKNRWRMYFVILMVALAAIWLAMLFL